jgi:dihydrofolate synthase/folylpolyglutamate synthase
VAVADKVTPPKTDSILKRLLELHPKKIDLSLGRIETLLAALGDPQKKLPPVLHIGGTNGKGSVAAIARAVLEAAGHRVHVYTSPHLVRFNERIRLAGKLVDDEQLVELLEECERVNDGRPITFFEITTAAAFLGFSRVPADACILEVGLGGRLDATNVIPDPLVCGISPVHLDHQAFLGHRLADIAAEKAGIIKPGVPVVVSRQPAAVERVIRDVAMKLRAPIRSCPADWRVRPGKREDEFIFEDRLAKILLPCPRLLGEHQLLNAGQAVAMLRAQGTLKVTEAALRAGLDWARWPARLQRLDDGPLSELLPEGGELWLDGGHNRAAGKVLQRFFRSVETEHTPFYLVAGMMSGKDAAGFFKNFAGLARSIYAVTVPGEEGSLPAAEVAAAASSVGLQGKLARDVPSALKAIAGVSRRGNPPVVLVTGSLYLAGEVLRLSGQIPQ